MNNLPNPPKQPDVLDKLREYHPDVSSVYIIDNAIAEIERLRAVESNTRLYWDQLVAAVKLMRDIESSIMHRLAEEDVRQLMHDVRDESASPVQVVIDHDLGEVIVRAQGTEMLTLDDDAAQSLSNDLQDAVDSLAGMTGGAGNE